MMPTPDECMLVDFDGLGMDSQIRVDVFLPETPKDRSRRHPAVVLLHGVEGADLQARSHYQTARRLNRQGYAVFFVHYFDCLPYNDLVILNAAGVLDVNAIAQACLRDSEAWTECVTEVVSAVTRREDVDASRLAIEGFSLGGYVALASAAELQFDDNLPDAAAVVVNWGAKFETTSFSSAFPPTLFVHGEHDDVVPLADASAAMQAIQDSGANAQLFVIPQGGHTASSIESIEKTEEFLAQHLQAQQFVADARLVYAVPAEIGQFQVHESLWAIW